MAGTQPLSVQEMRQRYGVTVPDGFEVIKWPVYHYQAYATAGAATFTFFNSIGTDPRFNNMESAASFPNPKKFLLRGIAVHFIPGNAPWFTTASSVTNPTRSADIHAVLNGAANLQLLVGNKQYMFGAPLGLFPSPVPLWGAGAVHFSQTSAGSLIQAYDHLSNSTASRDTFQMDPPLFIESQINFNVQINFGSALTINTASTIGVILLGQIIRPMQ